MSAEPRPHRTSPVDAGRAVAVGRHRVEMAGHDQPQGPAEVGAGHHVVPHPRRPRGAPSAASRCSTWSASAASWWLSDGMATRSAVRASRSVTPVEAKAAGPRTSARRRGLRIAGRRGGHTSVDTARTHVRRRAGRPCRRGARGTNTVARRERHHLRPPAPGASAWPPSTARRPGARHLVPLPGAGAGAAERRRCGGTAVGVTRRRARRARSIPPWRRRRASASTWAAACGPTPPGRVERRGGRHRSSTALDDPPIDAHDVYLRLHLLSHRLVAPHGANLDGLFGLLSNVVWTNRGPVLARRTSSGRGWPCGPPGGRCRCSGSTSSRA